METIEFLRQQIDLDIQNALIELESKIAEKNVFDLVALTELCQAIKHPFLAGGKRLRPLLTLLVAAALSGKKAVETARLTACAVEFVHTYSLVHDDLPCLDNDDFRRGQPTTHKIYGQAKGLLVGDALLTHAFYLVSNTQWPQGHHHTAECISVLSSASGPLGMVLGQWLDVSFPNQQQNQIQWPQLESLHMHKTGALLGACFELGSICAGNTSDPARQQAKSTGQALGLAFQIMDDILDATKSSSELGKTANKDVDQNKFTAVRLLGLDGAKKHAAHWTQICLNQLDHMIPNQSAYKEALILVVSQLLHRSH